MNNAQFDINVLNRIFDPTIKDKITTNLKSVKISNDDKHLLGYAEIKEVESVHIDEISFGKKLIEVSNHLESAILLTKENIGLENLQSTISFEFKKAVKEINSAFVLSELIKIETFLSKEFDSITALSLEISNNIKTLKSLLPKLENIIESNINSNDPRIQYRVNMLQQFYAFQQIRIKTMESNLEACKSILNNCSNFISFTLPNLCYRLQTTLYNTDISKTLLTFHDLHENEETKIYSKSNKSLYSSFFLIGSSIAIFLYSLLSLTENFKMVTGSFFWVGLIGGIFNIVNFTKKHISTVNFTQKHFSDSKDLIIEDLWLSFFLLSFFVGGFIISYLDMNFYNLMIVKNLSVSISMGVILFVGGALIARYISIKTIRPFKEELERCLPQVEKLTLMAEEYKQIKK